MVHRMRRQWVGWLIACSVLSTSCAGRVAKRETPRRPAAPHADVKRAVAAFKAQDPEASFTYFQGYVDSFATAAKPTVPDYALATLGQFGLSTAARTPRKLAAPIKATTPRPARDLDADTTLALPFVPEAASAATSQAPAELDAVEAPPEGRRPPKEARERPRSDADRMGSGSTRTWRRSHARAGRQRPSCRPFSPNTPACSARTERSPPPCGSSRTRRACTSARSSTSSR